MSNVFNHRYYTRLYKMNLRSIIGACECEKFDALNGNGCEYKLNDIYVYLWIYGNGPEICDDDRKELKYLFEKATFAFRDRYFEQTGHDPANYDWYLELIKSWS